VNSPVPDPIRRATSTTRRGQVPKVRRSDPGRRNPIAHGAIVESAWELLSEVGYHALSIEGVAERAGVGKATIYRWWPSKGALVAEALASHMTIGPDPSTDNSRRDMTASIHATIENYSGTIAGVALPALVADLVFDKEAYQSFVQNFLKPRRTAAATVIHDAISRGDLPDDTDVNLMLDMWSGTVFYRVLLSTEPIGDDLAERITDILFDGFTRRGET
jgi:AcrR family transcriptional regulator